MIEYEKMDVMASIDQPNSPRDQIVVVLTQLQRCYLNTNIKALGSTTWSFFFFDTSLVCENL